MSPSPAANPVRNARSCPIWSAAACRRFSVQLSIELCAVTTRFLAEPGFFPTLRFTKSACLPKDSSVRNLCVLSVSALFFLSLLRKLTTENGSLTTLFTRYAGTKSHPPLAQRTLSPPAAPAPSLSPPPNSPPPADHSTAPLPPV